MNLTAEQIQIASMVDTKIQALSGAGCDDATILGEMLDYMPGFKRLLDTSINAGAAVLREPLAMHYRRSPYHFPITGTSPRAPP